MPVVLAGQLVSPPVGSGAGGHAWLSLDEHCHLHYEISVAGLGRPADGTVSAHLHGVAELGEMGARPHQHKRLLKGFYSTEVRWAPGWGTPQWGPGQRSCPTTVALSPRQAQGVVKDLDADLLQHLAQGTAFLQVSTKAHPHGEMRGRVGFYLGTVPLPIPSKARGPRLGGTAQSRVRSVQGGRHAVTSSQQPGVMRTVVVGASSTTLECGGQPGIGMRSGVPRWCQPSCPLAPSRCTSPTGAMQEGPAWPRGRPSSLRVPRPGTWSS